MRSVEVARQERRRRAGPGRARATLELLEARRDARARQRLERRFKAVTPHHGRDVVEVQAGRTQPRQVWAGRVAEDTALEQPQEAIGAIGQALFDDCLRTFLCKAEMESAGQSFDHRSERLRVRSLSCVFPRVLSLSCSLPRSGKDTVVEAARRWLGP